MSLHRTTLVTEAYNLAEGQSEAAYRAALRALLDIRSRGEVDLLVVDPSSDGLGRQAVTELDSDIRYLSLPGLTYDQQKNRAAEASSTEFIAYLDGDCRPDSRDWLDRILIPFSNPYVEAVGGQTLYDDLSPTGQAMTILDFGYLFEPAGVILGCYASNNVAFRRSSLLACPAPEDETLRCNCYAHAQKLWQERRPLVMEPSALVWHELPDVDAERYRRGYDLVGACWVNPRLGQTVWLSHDDAESRFLDDTLGWAEKRLQKAPAALCVDGKAVGVVRAEIARLIEIDRRGVRDALAEGERQGLNAEALNRHTTLAIA